jgi:hypothetical protein
MYTVSPEESENFFAYPAHIQLYFVYKKTNNSKAYTKGSHHGAGTNFSQAGAYGHWDRSRPTQYPSTSRNCHAWRHFFCTRKHQHSD